MSQNPSSERSDSDHHRAVELYRAMALCEPGTPLQQSLREARAPGSGQLRLRVAACGVCRTDLHILDGDIAFPGHHVIPGHEIVGYVSECGPNTLEFAPGDRVGVPWLGWTCGVCSYCANGRENLCDNARFTGWQIEGGYAEYALADARYCFKLPAVYSDADAAPLLCAGLIGHRALTMAGQAERLGIYGFGAAAHIIAQVARHQGRRVFAFTRPGDEAGQEFARAMGAAWAGASTDLAPEALDAAIIFAPVGALVPAALRSLRKGGIVVCAGIHMSEVPAFPYEILWGERRIVSVANLTRADGEAFLSLAPSVPVRVSVETFPLSEANEALTRLREGRLKGAAVLVP